MNKAIITGLRNRIEAFYAADRATLPSELYEALKGLADGPRTPWSACWQAFADPMNV